MKITITLKTFACLLLTCLYVNILQAQQHLELPLWPEKAGAEDYNDAVVKVFLPASGNGMAIVACPGGGYSYLELEKEGTKFASYFNEQGIALIVLKYRLPKGRSDVPLNDARKAIQLVKANAEGWHIDKNKIGIMGSSAGGHLAATLSTHTNTDDRPAFQVLLYPVISMESDLTHPGSRKELLGANPDSSIITAYSNEKQVTAATPPAFIALSDDDKTVSALNSIYYYEALHKNKVAVELHVYPKGGHGWALNDNFLYKNEWTAALKKWLQSR